MRNPMTEIDLPYLVCDHDKRGNEYWYVRRRGKKIRLREKPGSIPFLKAYEVALAQLESAQTAAPADRKVIEGSLEWLGRAYFASSDFKKLDARSQSVRISILEACFAEPKKLGENARMGDCPLSKLGPNHIEVLRDRKAEKPGAANNRTKYLSSMFKWAIRKNLMKVNHAREVDRLEYETDGFHTWTSDEVKQFEAKHAIGTKARLALALLIYTGARRSDVVLFGRQHIKSGILSFVPRKTAKTTRQRIDLPVLPALRQIIDQSPTGDLTFLVNKFGKGFTAAGFGNWFRDKCDEAGLPQCAAHGLRKAAATLAAERGATDRQLMAIFGWSDSKMATAYTRAADKKRLAEGAVEFWAPENDAKT